jgi:anthranilate phosphoribosyltransferase
MDEASLQGENYLAILEHGEVMIKTLLPEETGLPQYENSSIKGGNTKENAEILLQVLKGEKGPYRDTVLLNAGIGIYTANKADSIQEGVKVAQECIDTGAAYEKLRKLIEKSSSVKREAI